jgi:hypothetical protein
MIRLATLIDTFEADFLAHYRGRLSSEHYRVLAAMKQCRTQASPMMLVKCSGCEQQKLVPHSCGHRHCPHCQHHEGQQWLERQMKKQVPAEYFLLTFTLPAQFRALSWAHQGVIYELLMRGAWETVRTFSQNDQQLHGMPGAIAVLHTNTRQLEYHPHVHLVMPAAAIDAKQRQWRTKRPGKTKAGYLFNHKALAKVFRAKMLGGIEAAGLTLPQSYPKKWVVDCKSVGNGEKALLYLGRYLYRGVIAERDIVACDNGQVSFRYRNAKTGKLEQRSVPGPHFLWLVLQHALPKGFRRARNYGFLHSNCKRVIALLQVLLKFVPAQIATGFKQRAPILCACCGAVMTIIKTRIRAVFTEIIPATIVPAAAH